LQFFDLLYFLIGKILKLNIRWLNFLFHRRLVIWDFWLLSFIKLFYLRFVFAYFRRIYFWFFISLYDRILTIVVYVLFRIRGKWNSLHFGGSWYPWVLLTLSLKTVIVILIVLWASLHDLWCLLRRHKWRILKVLFLSFCHGWTFLLVLYLMLAGLASF